MTTPDDFLNLEVNHHTKKILLDTITRVCTSDIEREELIFNVYSITILPKKNEVLISNDICPDEILTLSISLNEFKVAIIKFIPKS